MINRKPLIVGLIVLTALIIIGAIFWFLFFRKATKKEKVLSPSKITSITTDITLFPTFFEKEKTVFYMNKEGKIVKRWLEETKEEAISDVLEAPEKMVWSPDFSAVILFIRNDIGLFKKFDSKFQSPPEVPDGARVPWLYQINNKSLKRLDWQIDDLLWLPSGQQIIYHYLKKDNGESQISQANPDLSKWEKIVELPGPQEEIIALLENKHLIAADQPSDVSPASIWDVNLSVKKLKELFSVSENPQQLKRINENQFLLEVKKDGKSKIFLANVSGQKEELETTTPLRQIVIWDEQTIIFVQDSKRTGQKELIKQNLATKKKGKIYQYSEGEQGKIAQLLKGPEQSLYFLSDQHKLFKINLD
ncbi:hypothetical protein HY373_00330 [Candidatus Berkelbacteria bacterium]|nr:hypothetical protein [Candidatus Berkelbacteria bacterium]